jgi:hypothetical protein
MVVLTSPDIFTTFYLRNPATSPDQTYFHFKGECGERLRKQNVRTSESRRIFEQLNMGASKA